MKYGSMASYSFDDEVSSVNDVRIYFGYHRCIAACRTSRQAAVCPVWRLQSAATFWRTLSKNLLSEKNELVLAQASQVADPKVRACAHFSDEAQS